MRTVILNARIVNEGRIIEGDVLINGDRIEQIGAHVTTTEAREIDAAGCCLMPGIIHDQVHFREPGLTHKACIATESTVAAAGGVTCFMDMPNVKPPSLIALHCEDEKRIRERSEQFRQRYGEAVPFAEHPHTRDEMACWLSSSYAVNLARMHNTRLHVLHISTAEELVLFEPGYLAGKRITAEA